MVEQQLCKLLVGSSNLSSGTIITDQNMIDEFENLPPPATKMLKYFANCKQLESLLHQREIVKEQLVRWVKPNLMEKQKSYRILSDQIIKLRKRISQYEQSKSF